MFRTRFAALSFVFMMTFVLTLDAAREAQGQRRGRRPRSAIDLASRAQVRKELQVTDEQTEQINKLVDAYRNESRQLFGGLRDVSREERAKKMAEMQTKRSKIAADADQKLADLLNEDQRKRLLEIVVQILGAHSLERDDVAEPLSLSKEQRTKINGIVATEQKRGIELFEELLDGKTDRSEMREKFGKIRAEIDAQMLEVLNMGQKDAFEKMKGKNFEIDS